MATHHSAIRKRGGPASVAARMEFKDHPKVSEVGTNHPVPPCTRDTVEKEFREDSAHL